jgi:hypothetical protein
MNRETVTKVVDEAKAFFSETEDILNEGLGDLYERANRLNSDLSPAEQKVLKSAYWFIRNAKTALDKDAALTAAKNFGAL